MAFAPTVQDLSEGLKVVKWKLQWLMAGRNERRWTHFSRGGLPSEELVIEWAVSWVELGLEEYAAVGYRLQRGWAFVRETKADEELEKTNVLNLVSPCLQIICCKTL